MHRLRTSHDGYIALLTVLVLMAVMLALIASISTAVFVNRGNEYDAQTKETAYSLAYGCLDHAQYKLSVDPGYVGNEVVSMGTYQCSIGTISGPDVNLIRTFTTGAKVQNVRATLAITLDISNHIITFVEQ